MQAVLSYLKKNDRRFLAELKDYIKFPSVSAQPKHNADTAACAGWIQSHLKGIGLETTLYPTKGQPVVLARTPRTAGSKRPHFLVYGHYDVQPPEPFELWKTPPFEATVKGDNLFARGSTDNKGQNFAHIKAVEAYLKTGTPLPCDLTLLLEGEEEVGSTNLSNFLKAHRKELACDAIVISDNGMPDLDHPALTYGLRGIAALEIKITGPSRDLHSGLYGGSLMNPAIALAKILAQIHDASGKVTIPGFYADVVALSAYERKQLARLPYKESEFKKFLGIPKLFGEKGYTSWEQRTARPTFEINGLTSGYQGHGSKTIVPSWANAKITMRLVPNQTPAKIAKLVEAHLKKICPPYVTISVEAGHGGEPYLVAPDGVLAQASLKALRSAFGKKPVLMREGGSIPIVTDFKKILGADTLLLGLGLPNDNPHSPNEKMSLTAFRKGMQMSALLWPELSAALLKTRK